MYIIYLDSANFGAVGINQSLRNSSGEIARGGSLAGFFRPERIALKGPAFAPAPDTISQDSFYKSTAVVYLNKIVTLHNAKPLIKRANTYKRPLLVYPTGRFNSITSFFSPMEIIRGPREMRCFHLLLFSIGNYGNYHCFLIIVIFEN